MSDRIFSLSVGVIITVALCLLGDAVIAFQERRERKRRAEMRRRYDGVIEARRLL